MWQYTYLLINLIIISIPLLLTWHPKLDYYKDLRFVLSSIVAVSTPFIIWDSIFTQIGVWAFNPLYTTGLKLFHLPIEEILFFITVPYACLFTYRSIQYYVPNDLYPTKPKLILIAALICLLLGLYSYPLIYTSTIGILVGAMLLFFGVWFPQFLFHKLFLVYSIITLFLFIVFNIILTSLPVVIYNPSQITNIRIFTIPIEDFFYNFLLLTSYLFVFTTVKKRYNSSNSV